MSNLAAQNRAGGDPPVRIGDPRGRHERDARDAADRLARNQPAPVAPAPNVSATDHPKSAAIPTASRGWTMPGAGQPLATDERARFEQTLGESLDSVRVHAGGDAAGYASALGARAFTYGEHLFFGHGQYAPHTAAGRELLAHEVAHTVQQRNLSQPIVQGDFFSDFGGRLDVPVEGTAVQPPGTVRVKNFDGVWVYAPYGIYKPADVPPELQNSIMESGKAFQWRSPTATPLAQLKAEQARGGNVGELAIRDMTALSQGAGSAMNIRVLMARVGNDYRFVGYDMSDVTGGAVAHGFVEAEAGTTGGVGSALFADRVVRAIGEGRTSMFLEVYTTQRTEDFHAQLFRVVGRPGMPAEGDKYSIDTREMVRVALSWSGALTPAQRQELVKLAAQEANPTPAEAQTALAVGAPVGSARAGAPGGFSPEALEAARGLARQVSSNIVKPAALERHDQLSDPDVAAKIVSEHGGYATVGGRMYRVQVDGASVRFFELNPIAIRQAFSAVTESAPQPDPSARSRSVFDPPPTPRAGTSETEQPQEVREGDVIVVPYQTFFEARDAASKEVFFGIFESARWYRLQAGTGEPLRFDPLTGEQLVKTGLKTAEGVPLVARPWDPEPYTPAQLRGASPVARGAVGVGGAIMVLNELLGPYGAALQVQRGNIARGHAEIAFWNALGANPVTGVWDNESRTPAPEGQRPDTGIFSHHFFPYVLDIDAARLRTNIPLRAGSYQEIQSLLAIGRSLGAVQEKDGKYFAAVNRVQRDAVHIYDITASITQTMTQTLGAQEERLRAQVAALPPDQRSGRIFQMKAGAPIYRSEQGQQMIMNSGEQMGPSPWVREVSRRSSNVIQYLWTGYSGTRVLVAPANADAYRAAAFARYPIYKPLDDAWKEAKAAGRSVNPSELPRFLDDPIASFTAGPGRGEVTEFGVTSYVRHPENPGQWTLATGELGSFWVSAENLTPVDEEPLNAFLRH